MSKHVVLGSIVALSFVSACAGTGDERSSDPVSGPTETESNTPVAPESLGANAESSNSDANAQFAILEVDVEEDHTVTFYDFGAAGGLVIRESRLDGQKRVLGNDQVDAVELFQTLRPGEEIPPTLQAAYDRSEQWSVADRETNEPVARESGAAASAPEGNFVSAKTPAPSSAEQDRIGSIAQAHSLANCTHFTSSHQYCRWGTKAFTVCICGWPYSTNYWAQAGSPSASCTVDHYSGNGITVQLTAGGTVVPFSHSAGTVQTYAWGLVGGNILRRVDILNASGDGFHIACGFD